MHPLGSGLLKRFRFPEKARNPLGSVSSMTAFGPPLQSPGLGGGQGWVAPALRKGRTKTALNCDTKFHLLEPRVEERLSRERAPLGLGRDRAPPHGPSRTRWDSAGPPPHAHGPLPTPPARAPAPPAQLTGPGAHRDSESLSVLGRPDAQRGRRSRKHVTAPLRTVVRDAVAPLGTQGESRQRGSGRHLQRAPEGISFPRPR